MPTFRMKNLTVTLGEEARLGLTPQIYCAIPTNNCNIQTVCLWPTHCNFGSIYCNAPTLLTCWGVSPQTCWNITCLQSQLPCRFNSPDPCGALSPVCDMSMTPTILDTIQGTSPIILQASDAELEALRADMDTVIKTIRERGSEIAEGGRPKTREQVEMLERELKSALKEVEAMKKEMK